MQKIQLYWSALFYAAWFGFVGLYSPFLGPYLKSIGYGLDMVALAVGSMQAMRILGPFIWGWLADHSKLRVRWLRIGSIGGLLFCALAFAGVAHPVWLVVMVIGLNLLVSGLVPMADTYVMEGCAGCSGCYGRVRLAGSLGFIASVLFFGWLADYTGSMNSYPLWALLCLLLVVFAVFGFKESNQSTTMASASASASASLPLFRSLHASMHVLWAKGEIRWFWLSNFLMIFAHGVFYAFYSLYLLRYGYKGSSIGMLWAFGVFCEVVFFAGQQYFFRRYSLPVWLNLSFLACAVRFAWVAMFPETLWVMVLAQALHSLTFAAHHSAVVAWLRQYLPTNLLVRGQALYTVIAYGFGGTLGTWFGRLCWENVSPVAAFWLAALAGLLAFVVGLRFMVLSSVR